MRVLLEQYYIITLLYSDFKFQRLKKEQVSKAYFYQLLVGKSLQAKQLFGSNNNYAAFFKLFFVVNSGRFLGPQQGRR